MVPYLLSSATLTSQTLQPYTLHAPHPPLKRTPFEQKQRDLFRELMVPYLLSSAAFERGFIEYSTIHQSETMHSVWCMLQGV